MPVSKEQRTEPRKNSNGRGAASNVALTELHRGVKAIAFYPEHHPLRAEIIGKAYQALASVVEEGVLSLIVQRNGLSFADREMAVESNPMINALAKELFAREVQQLTFLPGLSPGEFTAFLSLLAMEPQKVIGAGGMAALLKGQGIQAVVANEIDITAVFTKKTVADPADEAAAEEFGTWEGSDQGPEPAAANLSDNLSELEIEELIALMQTEMDDDRYSLLAGCLQAKGRSLRKEGAFDRLFPLLPALLKQHADPARSTMQGECAVMTFRELAREEMLEHLLDHLEDKDFSRQEAIFPLLAKLEGEAADAVIRRIITSKNLSARKTLATALQWIGPPALPALISLLKDSRWQVVRTAVTILGEIGSRDAVQGLAPLAYHHDKRVRMEAIRSLARIGGREATLLLIDLLSDKEAAINKQAIIWMGNTRNEKALQPLLQLIARSDPLGRSVDLKKEAVIAIGRIGDRRALDPLFRLARKRHLLFPGRFEGLKVLAVETIGQLGGADSREYLEKLSGRGGRIKRVCTTLLAALEQGTSASHE